MKSSKVIIVGGGVAGLMTALKAAEQGISVQIFSDVRLRRSYSVSTKSGINSALDTKGQSDSVDQHAKDTIASSSFLMHEEPIALMCSLAPEIVHMFDRMGVTFNRTDEDHIDLVSQENSIKCRTAMAGESTGSQLLFALDDQLRKFELSRLVKRSEFWQFNSLIKAKNGNCAGIIATNLRSMEIKAFPADTVIISAGGYSQLYSKSLASTNSTGSVASAIYQQGVPFANGEFVHFDAEGNVDYTMGGLYVDKNQMTNIPGLFAVGECNYLYHGAGVLEGNQLLSEVVSGFSAGLTLPEYLENCGSEGDKVNSSFAEEALKVEREKMNDLSSSGGEENIYQLITELKGLMSEKVGPQRDNSMLMAAVEEIQRLEERSQNCATLDKLRWANKEVVAKCNFHNMLQLAKVVAQSALKRDETRGTHAKPEFPDRDDKDWRKITKVEFVGDSPLIDYELVETSCTKMGDQSG